MSNNFLDKDGLVVGPVDFNFTLGRKAVGLVRSFSLCNEDLAAINAIATALAGTLTVTANVGTGTQPVSGTFWQTTQPVSGTVTANAGTGTFAVSAVAPSSTSRLLSAAGTTNATSVKASGGTLKAIQGYNAKTSPVFLKLYNKTSAPTVGTDTPVKTIYLPASSAFALDFGFTFSTGIAYALTGALADADTTALVAGDILCLNVDYI